MPKIVSVSGSTRPDNYTFRALGVVNDELRKRGHDVEVLDVRELHLEFPGHGVSEDAKRLQAALGGATGVVLATPEYHGSFSAATKLIIENLGFPSALRGKPVGLVGVAAGRIGAIKSLEQLRGVCAHVGAIVMPGAVSVAGVQNAFDDAGNCTDPGVEAMLRGAAESLTDFIREYVCPKHALEEMVRREGEAWSAEV
jgi:chromate reductase, NAD(P)H dehydrogenase (quinone)